MKKSPLKLYSYYLEEKEKMLNNKDFTQKTYNNLRKIEKQLQKVGLLPINKWNF